MSHRDNRQDGSGYQSSSSGSQSSGRGRQGGSQGSRGDNLPQQMGRMNMYSQHPPSRSTVPRVAQQGDLVGSAQHPNAPFPKANLAHHQQEFAKRPEGSVYDRPKVGTKTELTTNHVLIHLPQQPLKLYCYHIKVLQNRKVLTKREEAGPIFWNIVRQSRREFPEESFRTFIFNDVDMLWSLVQLPKAQGGARLRNHTIEYKFTSRVDFGQTIREDQDRQLLATLVDAIATHRVRHPTCTKYTVYKRCIFMLQTVPENPDEVCDAPLTVPLGHGLDARIGISIAVRLNLRAGITACFDTTHTLFTRTGYPLIRLLCELINGDVITDDQFVTFWDERLRTAVVTEDNRRKLDEILTKMRLRYSRDIAIQIDENGRETVPSLLTWRDRGKLFKYYRLTPGSAANTLFKDHENREWTVAEWFLKCCNIRLRYPNLPCFERKKTKQKSNFCVWPMEFVSYVTEPKRFGGLQPKETKDELIKHTTIHTAPQGQILFDKIIGQNQIADCPPLIDNNDDMMRTYGLEFEKEMMKVRATVLPAATVEYGGGYKFQDKEHVGEWEAVTHDPCLPVLDGSIYVRDQDKDAPKRTKRLLGSILNVCSPMNRRNTFDYDTACYHRLMKAIEKTGQPVAWENKDIGQAAIHGKLEFSQNENRPEEIIEFLKKLKADANVEENRKKYTKSDEEVLIPLVWIVFEVRCSTITGGRDDFANEYNFIKYLGDSALGVYTQGILSKNLSIIQENPVTCKLTRLIVEKVLGKVGTTHRKLEREGDHKSWTKFTDPKSPTLVLGVDVSHPSPRDRGLGGVRSLSVASVVGNIDFDCTEFRTSCRIQDAGEEMIVRFQDEISARLNDFQRNTGVLPAHIVMYRDGLGETDFKRILWEERRSIEKCCKDISASFEPTITYIVCTKRHHTKFFLKNHKEGHEKHGYNVLPGTLVEDKVTTNEYFDFFLATQIGQTGIARPTHYYVLWDEWKPYVAFWPTVTHALTYLFCRTTSVVSLPSPVLYAHLAAKRAKEHIDGAENYAKIHHFRLSYDNVHDVEKLTKAINTNNGLDGMTFV